VVVFTGRVPIANVPRRRRNALHCNEKEKKHFVAIVNGGGLEGTLVRIEAGGVPGQWRPPAEHARLSYVDCELEPRIQGAMVNQQLDIVQADVTLHNAHLYRRNETWSNHPLPKGADPITKELTEVGIVAVTDDVHPWEHAFVMVTDHPFFAVSDASGSFAIPRVPPGQYQIDAWHPRYGLKRARIEITPGHGVELGFQYDGTEPQPAENHEGPGRTD
jgi:hypothetical protein